MADIETSAEETPTVPVDHRTQNEKDITAHLKDVELPGALEAAEARESARVDEITNSAMPKTLKETLALLAEANAIKPADKFSQRVKSSKLEKLAAHAHALSQGPPVPAINHVAFHKRTPPLCSLEYISKQYPKTKPAKV